MYPNYNNTMPDFYENDPLIAEVEDYSNLQISIAEVRDSVSQPGDGSFPAFVHEENCIKNIIFTSPFRAGESGGFAMFPSMGQKILVCQPTTLSGKSSWHYLSTIYSPPDGLADGNEDDEEKKHPLEGLDKDFYRATGFPMRYIVKSAEDHMILLSDEESDGGEDGDPWVNKRLEIKSGVGKRLKLLDSPEQDAIFLVNEHRDGIKISSEPDEVSAAQSIEIESRGPQKIICRESQTDVWVNEGRELNLINNSTGKFKGTSAEHWGNLNLESANRDINLQGMGDGSRVFIYTGGGGDSVTTQEQTIQLLASSGRDTTQIILFSGGGIGIHSEFGKINIESKEDINIVSEKKININGKQGVNIDAGGEGDIHLNSGNASDLAPDKVSPRENHYGNGKIY